MDIASHFALPGLLASVLAWGLALLVTRKGERSALWLAVVGTLCWGLLLAPDYAARLSGQRSAVEGHTLKVVQFNLWAVNSDREGTSAWILAQDPDVVVLEEVSGVSDRVVRRLAERYPYAHSCADPSPCSTMILSKAQPLASGGQISPVRAAPTPLSGFTSPGPTPSPTRPHKPPPSQAP
jgi:endonuclease/exonuclease/phosphatase (EEP) superfamily protein YafD